MYVNIIKPVYDWILAFFALIILSPLLFIIAILIKIDSPGPVFFLQERLGKKGKVFKIVKFRSMVNRPDNFMFGKPLLANDPKITKMGSFVRKTSIDEIPQLINILKGDMSFIGPRPPVVLYPKKYEDYNEFEKRRFEVKPGLSGFAAVRAREVNDWSKIIPMDVEYVDKISFVFDVQLFFASLFVFFKTDNVYTKIENKK
ncbi:MAG: sugar transferase [Bacteroidales bacterium]|nr:sugar transferase [Bacteroidales bacterium]